MYGYQNEAGEPIMDGAAYRYEQYLDSMYEPDPYDYEDNYDEPEQADTATCTHGNGSYPENAGFSCDDCWETYEGPRLLVEAFGFSGEYDVFMSRNA